MKKKSIYRILLIVLGLLHLLPFFVLPYAESALMSGLGDLAGALGMSSAESAGKLTGLAMFDFVSLVAYGDDTMALLIIVFFTAPAVLGVGIALLQVLGKGKGNYILTIIFSLIQAGCYGFITILLSDFAQVGYESSSVAPVFLVITVAQFIIAIVGLVKDNGQADGTGNKVRVGKNDGTITGVYGSYTGAVIPVRNGETVAIGRDPAACSIVVKDEKASRQHCIISFNGENGMYSVTDTSSNGVFDRMGGRLPVNMTVPMPAGSEIQIGKNGDVFRLG